MIRTNNPALSASTFGGYADPADADFSPAAAGDRAAARPGTMTLQGCVNKTFILLTLCAATAVFAWSRIIPASAVIDGTIAQDAVGSWAPWTLGGAIGGLVVALIIIFKPTTAPVLAPVYALLEGLFIGGISAMYAIMAGGKELADGALTLNYGIIIQAALLTFGILAALLIAYTSRIIKPTENFKLGIVAATGGIFLVFLAQMALGFFGVQIPGIFGTGPIGIGFAGFIVVIAALNLVLDFDFIEQGVEHGAPKQMEWMAGFGLLVTLVWLYISILRLLYLLTAARE